MIIFYNTIIFASSSTLSLTFIKYFLKIDKQCSCLMWMQPRDGRVGDREKLIRKQWAAVCGQPEQKVLAPQSGMEDTEKAEWQVRENTRWVMVRWCQSWWPWE